MKTKTSNLRVAIVHNMFWRMRGAEKCVVEFLKLYPDAELFALFGLTDNKIEREFPPEVASKEINYSWLQRIPGIDKIYRATTPFWPVATEAWDFSGYDLVISSSSTTVKGVITPIETTHVSYIYSPMRYLWDQKDLYLRGRGVFTRGIFKIVSNYTRIWDVTSNGRIDYMISISEFVSKRIRKYYDIEPDSIIYPVVDVEGIDELEINEKRRRRQYLMVSPFQENKGAEDAINYALKEKVKLILVGDGPERDNLLRKYGKSQQIFFPGWVSDEELYKLISESTAVLFFGIEDFGLVPVESAVLGTPVVALAKGGALESVKEGVTGVFVEDMEHGTIKEALLIVNDMNWDRNQMREFANGFSADRFQKKFSEEVFNAMKEKETDYEI